MNMITKTLHLCMKFIIDQKIIMNHKDMNKATMKIHMMITINTMIKVKDSHLATTHIDKL